MWLRGTCKLLVYFFVVFASIDSLGFIYNDVAVFLEENWHSENVTVTI